MKKFPKYTAYKDSEIEWANHIPSHWEVLKLKHIFLEKKIKHNPSLNCGSISYGEVVYKNNESVPESTKASYQEVLEGEFLINPLNLNYDLKSLRIALSDLNVVVSSGYIVLKNHLEIDKRYYKYLLHIYDIAYMKLLGSGVRQTINFNHISSSLLAFPPLQEQTAIANFLNKKTAEIKEFIALKEKTIELLKERKMAIINELVTGKKVWNGTEWTAPIEVKDSGIEWLGKIPKDWEVKKLKYVSKIIYGISPHESTYNIEGKGKILINGPAEYSVENFGYTRAIKWTTLPVKFARKGDLLFCLRGSTTGRLNICHDDVAIGRGCAALRGEIDQDFFILAIYSLKEKIIETFKGSTFPSVTSEDLNNYSITFCSETEMKKIVKKANEINLEIDDLIIKTQSEINLIKEYQQSLISEVVTGKVDVRDLNN